MDHILDTLADQGRIEKVPLSEPCPIASPAFVTYNNGKPRVVVDLRKVNTKLVPDAYPLPQQDDVLNTLGGSTIFSSLDFTKFFFQQRINPEDKNKTAFVAAVLVDTGGE